MADVAPSRIGWVFFFPFTKELPPSHAGCNAVTWNRNYLQGCTLSAFCEPAKKIVRMEHGIISGYLTSELSAEGTIHSFLEGDRIFGNFTPHVAALIDLEALENTVLSVSKCEKIMGVVN